MRLGDLISVHCLREGKLLQPGDVVIRRIGREDDVGRVLAFATEPQLSPTRADSAYVLRVKDKTRLQPTYLRYLMEYIHTTGYYRSFAKGSTRRKCVRLVDVTNIPIQE